MGPSEQKQNPVGSTNTYLPPWSGRSSDLPMMRYDLPFTNPKCSLQLGRAKNCLTFPSASSSVPIGQNRRQFYRDVPNASHIALSIIRLHSTDLICYFHTLSQDHLDLLILVYCKFPGQDSKTEVILLFLLSTLSYGIASRFKSELPQLYLFLSLLLKLILSPWHSIFIDLLRNDFLF